jgi:hypothetical protein
VFSSTTKRNYSREQRLLDSNPRDSSNIAGLSNRDKLDVLCSKLFIDIKEYLRLKETKAESRIAG